MPTEVEADVEAEAEAEVTLGYRTLETIYIKDIYKNIIQHLCYLFVTVVCYFFVLYLYTI